MISDIHFYESGSGPTLVFQHGLTANSSQIERLLGPMEKLHIICADCPGHGASQLDSGRVPSFENYANEIISLLGTRKIENVYLGGLSMGAGIALNIAVRFPSRVKALIFLRPAWLNTPFPQNLSILQTASTYLNHPNGNVEFQKLESFLRLKAQLPGAANSLLGIFADHQQDCLEMVISSLVSDTPLEKMSELEKIDCPCLILGNDHDPLHPFSIAHELSLNIKNSELKKVTSRYVNDTLHGQEIRHHIMKFIKNLS